MIRLAIVEDSEFLRLGLRIALETGSGIEVIGEYSLTSESVLKIETVKPDVALVSMRWPATDGLGICRDIRNRVPETKVVMLSSTSYEEEMLASIIMGASGHISMNAPGTELTRVIHIVANGSTFFDQGVTDRVISRLREMSNRINPDTLETLTDRDVAILTMISDGRGNEEIGQRLKVATTTVRNHITRLRSKLGLRSRSALAAYAVRRELLYDWNINPGGSEGGMERSNEA